MQTFSLNGLDIEKSAVKSAVENNEIIYVILNSGIEIRIPKNITPMTANDFTVEEINDVPIRNDKIWKERFGHSDCKFGEIVGYKFQSNLPQLIILLLTTGETHIMGYDERSLKILREKMCGDTDEIYVRHDKNSFFTMKNGKEIQYNFDYVLNWKYEMKFDGAIPKCNYAFFNYCSHRHIIKECNGNEFSTLDAIVRKII